MNTTLWPVKDLSAEGNDKDLCAFRVMQVGRDAEGGEEAASAFWRVHCWIGRTHQKRSGQYGAG